MTNIERARAHAKAAPISPPWWIKMIFPEEMLFAQEVTVATETVAIATGAIVSAIVFFFLSTLTVCITAALASFSTIEIETAINIGVLLIVIATWKSYNSGRKSWNECHKGTRVVVRPSHKGVLIVSGARVERILNEGIYTFPKIRLPFNLFSSLFEIGVKEINMQKIPYDVKDHIAMTDSRAGLKVDFTVGIRTYSRPEAIYSRSQYDDNIVRDLILDEVATAIGIATKGGDAKQYVDTTGDIDWLNAEVHRILDSPNTADMEYLKDPEERRKGKDMGDLWHKHMGCVVTPYVKSHDYTREATALAMEAPARSKSQKKAMRTDMKTLDESVEAAIKIFNEKHPDLKGDLTVEDARMIGLTMMGKIDAKSLDLSGAKALGQAIVESIAGLKSL